MNQITNKGQHLYKHKSQEIRHVDATRPTINTVKKAIDDLYEVASGMFAWKEPVATKALLPLTGNTINDARIVQDDGDGNPAAYVCIATTGTLYEQWSKIADVDWGGITTFVNIAEAKASAGSNNDYCFVQSLSTFYQYVASGGAYASDDVFVLTTGDGGDTRWLSVAGANNYNSLNVFNETLLQRNSTPYFKSIDIQSGTFKSVFIATESEHSSIDTFNAQNNLIVGLNAGDKITTAADTTVYGMRAFENGTNNSRTSLFGYYSGNAMVAGSTDCSGFGAFSMQSLEDATFCSAFGSYAMSNFTQGESVDAFGVTSLAIYGTGNRTAGFGRASLFRLEGGSDNVGFGYLSGGYVNLGDRGTYLGVLSGPGYDITGNNDCSDNVCVGYKAGSGAIQYNNRLYIAIDESIFPLIYGEFDNEILGFNASVGIKTQSPVSSLHIYQSDASDNSVGNYYATKSKGLLIGEDLDTGLTLFKQNTNSAVLSNGKLFIGDTNDSNLGSEILYDTSDFSQATWSLAGDFAIDGTGAKFTNSTGGGTVTQAYGDFDIEVDNNRRLYKFTCVVSGLDIDDGASINIDLGSDEGVLNIKLSNGTNTAYIEGKLASNFVLTVSGASSGGFKVDSISLLEISEGDVIFQGDVNFLGSVSLNNRSLYDIGTLYHSDTNDFSITNQALDRDILFTGNDGGVNTLIMSLDVSAGQLSGLIKATAGVLSGASAGTDYIVPNSINPQTGTTYTFALTDANIKVTFNNANAQTITVPKNAVVAFPTGTQIDCIGLGAGKVTFAPVDGDVTINSKDSNKSISAPHVGVTLVKIAENTWELLGDLIA